MRFALDVSPPNDGLSTSIRLSPGTTSARRARHRRSPRPKVVVRPSRRSDAGIPASGTARVGSAKRFRRVARAAGIDDLRIHDLRHFTASTLTAAGVADNIISLLTGHKSRDLRQGVGGRREEWRAAERRVYFTPTSHSLEKPQAGLLKSTLSC